MKMKKILAALLCLTMMLSTLSLTAFANGETTSQVDSWDGTADTSWYNESDTEFTLMSAEALAGFGKLVDEGNTFEGKTVKLGADIDLYLLDENEEKVSFNPIGYGYNVVFKGTFDGQGHTISNLYQNGWALGYSYSTEAGGLFASVVDATIQNLNIDGAEIVMECIDMGIVVGYSYGNCAYENITVTNSSIANYQRYTGGVVGEVNGTQTFKNVDVADTVTVASLWGDFDASLGGIIGGKYGEADITFEDCDVACCIDAQSDVVSSYQWYAYRRAGMLIGNTETSGKKPASSGDGSTYATAPFVTVKNCSVTIGDWANYTYCEFAGKNWPWVRVQAGLHNDAYSNARYGHPTDANGNTVVDDNHVHNDGEGHFQLIAFDQLFGGGQGVYGPAVEDLKELGFFDGEKNKEEELTVVNDYKISASFAENYGAYAVSSSGEEGTEAYRERFGVDIYDISVTKSLILKIYSKGELLCTTSLRKTDRDDESNVLIPMKAAATTANVVVKGRLAGSWDTEWNITPSSEYMPDYIELYADGCLIDTYSGGFSESDMTAYKALSGVADGSEAKPFLINDIDDLELFRDSVNEGNNYARKYVKLNADIDLANEEWTPIGTSNAPFNGIFDGGDHTISNLSVNTKEKAAGKNDVGFFGRTNNGEVKNLTIHNAKVSGRLNVGVVAGTPYTTKYSNIKVTGHVEVDGMSYVGGMFGKNLYADATNLVMSVDEDSYVKADSVENGTAYRTYVGGIVGFMGEGSHTVSNVTSNIDVIGSTIDVGGITGIAHYNNTFVNCVCTGDVSIVNADEFELEIGGIAGVWHNGEGSVNFENCFHTGKLSLTKGDGTLYEGEFPNRGLYGTAYLTAGSGTLEEETTKIAVTFDYNGGTDKENRAETVILATLSQGINAPSGIKKDGYAFAGWSPEFDPVVKAPMTYVAQWSSLVDFNASVSAESDEIDPKGSFIEDVTISGGNWNQARITVAYDKELFTWNNLYDSDVKEDKDGNIVITVYGKDRVDGKIAKKLSFTAKEAEGLSKYTGKVEVIKAVIGTGDEAVTLDERDAANLGSDEITIVQTFKMTLGEGLSGDSTAKTNKDYEGIITDYINDVDYEYFVKGTSGGTNVVAEVTGNKFVLAKEDIKGDTVLEVTRKLKGIETGDITISEYVAGHSLIVLTADSSKNYTYNGAKMYIAAHYDLDADAQTTAYAYIVKGEITAEEALSKLGLIPDSLVEITLGSNDVNGTGLLDLNDVQAAWNFYNVNDRYDIYTYMDKYLNADVDKNMVVNAKDIADVFAAYKDAQDK